MTGPSLVDKILAIDESLRKSRIPHAFGGALALAYYAEPRATMDVDVNVFLPAESNHRVLSVLDPLGVKIDVDTNRVVRDGQVRLWWGANPVDIFFAYDDLHEAMRREMRKVPFGSDVIPIIGPEHLAVCKVVFDRAKDWIDLEQILIAVEHLDVEDILRWLSRILGTEDHRTQRFESLVQATLAD